MSSDSCRAPRAILAWRADGLENLFDNHREFFLEILGDAISTPKLSRHEFVEEVVPSLQLDYEQAQGNALVLGFDALTSTAFRHKGLGASLFASPSSPVSHSQTVQYAQGVLAKSNLALLGTGIEAQKLAALVSKSFAGVPNTSAGASSVAPKSASQYFGGEQRIAFAADHGVASGRSAHGHLFLGFQGAAQGAANAAELAVLRALLGGESRVKWSQGQSPLAQLAANAPGAAVHAFNLGFSDAGLFGLQVSAPHERLGAVAKAAVNALKDIAAGKGAGSEEVQRAVAKAKFEAASQLESRSATHEALAGQLLESGKIATLDSYVAALDKVDAKSLQAAAEKALKSKPTAVAIGDVHKLPYADEVL